MPKRCRHCATPLDAQRRWDTKYCDSACREAARRRRRAGLPEDTPKSRRGRLALGAPAKRDRELERARREGYEQGRDEAVVEEFRRRLDELVSKLGAEEVATRVERLRSVDQPE